MKIKIKEVNAISLIPMGLKLPLFCLYKIINTRKLIRKNSNVCAKNGLLKTYKGIP